MDDTLLHVSEIFPTYTLTPAAFIAFCVFAERKSVYEIPCSHASPLLKGKARCAHGGKKKHLFEIHGDIFPSRGCSAASLNSASSLGY